MKEEIIKQLKIGVEFADKEFNKGNHSDAYVLGYLEGHVKAVIKFLEQEDVIVKFKK